MSLALGLAVGKFALDYYGNKRQRKALDKAGKETPEQKQYKAKLTELSTKGDPNINSIRNRRISAIRQVGSDTQQKITGDLIQSGMENSVVASELRRRAGGDVMRQVAEESQKIAERNRSFKQQHQLKLDKYNMDRSQYLKQLSAKKDAIPDPTTFEGFVETALPHALDFGTSYATSLQEGEGLKSAMGLIPDLETFEGMEQEDFDKIISLLPKSQKAKMIAYIKQLMQGE